jgi:hypothetical protein
MLMESWLQTTNLDSLFQRLAGGNPPCGTPCLRDNSPGALAGLFPATCNDAATIAGGLATYADADRRDLAFAQVSLIACLEYWQGGASYGPPDIANDKWRSLASDVHERRLAPALRDIQDRVDAIRREGLEADPPQAKP